MRKLLAVFALAGLAFALTSSRANAVSYTLSDLVGLGGTGVTVGALTFYDFDVDVAVGNSGFDPKVQTIQFSQSGNCVTLTYTAPFITTGPNQLFSDLGFSYKVSGPGINYASASGVYSTIPGTFNTGNANDKMIIAFANTIRDANNALLLDVSTGLSKFGDGSVPIDVPSASGWFAPQDMVIVQKDLGHFIIYQNSNDPRQTLTSTYQQTFCYVPEPGTVALFLGLGVSSTLLVVARRRRK